MSQPAPDVTDRRPLRQRLAALPPAVYLLCVGTFINRFGCFVSPFLVYYLERRGHGATAAGLAVSAYGAGHLGANLLGGPLADHLGRRRTIALSMLLAAGFTLLLATVSSLPLLYLVVFLTGLTGEMLRPAVGALIADLTPKEDRLTAYAAYRVALNAGFAAGPAVAGFLAQRSLTILFVGDALTSAAYGLLVLYGLRGVHEQPAPSTEGPRLLPALRGQGAALRRFLLASMLIALLFFQYNSTFALLVADAGHPPSVYGLLTSLNGLIVVLLELPLTQVTRRLPPRRVLAFGYLLTGLGFALNRYARSSMALGGTVALWTLGEICTAPVASTYIANMAPPELRGRFIGAYGLTWSLGFLLGPALGMRLYAGHPDVYFLLCGILGVLAAALVARR